MKLYIGMGGRENSAMTLKEINLNKGLLAMVEQAICAR